MNLTQLRAFHGVARAGSFSLAARTGGASQPTLSAQVKALEANYGVGLFARGAAACSSPRPGSRSTPSPRGCSPPKRRRRRCSRGRAR